MISKPTSGMAHLIGQSHPQTQQAQGDPWQPLPKGKCTCLRLVLGGREFYIPGDVRYGVFEMVPPFPVDIPLAYSEIRKIDLSVCDKEFSIPIKHEGMRIFGTGFTTEIVNEPAWWAKREENI